MTRRSGPKLSADRAKELVAEVVASDRQQARTAIARGVHSAKEQWLEAPIIAEALALELIAIAERNNLRAEVAADVHHSQANRRPVRNL